MSEQYLIPACAAGCRSALCYKGFGPFSIPYRTGPFRAVYRIGAETPAEVS